MSDHRKATRDKIKNRYGLSFSYGRSGVPGTYTAEACHEDFPMPLCVVWFGFVALDGIQILGSFTDERYRRCGLRTYVHESMTKAYPTRHIVSGGGTKSGAAWMKATGYKQTKAGWEFHQKNAGTK